LYKVDIYINEEFTGTTFVEAHDEEEAEEKAREEITIDLDIEEI